jgi:hypothetical protein
MNGKPGAWDGKWTGVLMCGHIWTCPVCSVRIRGERCKRVLRAVSAAGGRWQMATFTVRHHDGMPLQGLFKGTRTAWRGTRQGGKIQRIWTKRVSASVRAFEITHSKNGWHPHVHVLLRTSEWSDEEKADLLARWKLQVERALGLECVPADEFAIVWSDPIDLCKGDELSQEDHQRTRYLFKLGLEIAGTNKKGRRGSRTSWQIAEDAALHRDAASVGLWLEYCRATKGQRMIELDDRAQRYAKTPDPNRDDKLHESTSIRLTIPVDSLELRALREYERRFSPAVLSHMMADAIVAEDPKTVVKAWLDLVCARVGYAQGNGQATPTSRFERSRPTRAELDTC